MSFIEEVKEKARKNLKTIVLPECEDDRILYAASTILKEGFANVILIGNAECMKSRGIDITGATIIDPKLSDKSETYAFALYELRKEKGMTEEQAKELVLDPVYYGMMMVKCDDADGLVSGACHSTADTLRPALQILKTAPETKIVSTFFVMIVPNCEYGENGTFVFSDCALVENPDAEAMSEIAIASAKSYKDLIGTTPKVAMLSYSTMGSAKSEQVDKVANATKLVKEKDPTIEVDGEMQLDAAIIPEVGKSKAPNSKVAGVANTLIFPNLESGNIGYKLVQRLAKAEAYGPVTQGIAKPVNDLSRGCTAEDIVGVVALTCLQAQSK